MQEEKDWVLAVDVSGMLAQAARDAFLSRGPSQSIGLFKK